MKRLKDFHFCLYDSKSFWKLRAWLQNKKQKVSLSLLHCQNETQRHAFSAKVIIYVLRSILLILLFSFLIFLAAQSFDIPLIGFLSWIAKETDLNILSYFNAPAKDHVVSLFGTIVQIAGIFLGLYYAAVGVVISTAYAHFPQSLRFLLIKERVGNLYIAMIAVLATISLFALTFNGIGIQTSRSTYLLVCLLSVFAVLSFVRFGQHVFNLFDLTTILPEPYHKLLAALRRVSTIQRGDFNSVHESSRLEALRVLKTYDDILSVSSENIFDRNRIALSVLEHLLSSLSEYATIKGRIPTDSRWFPKVFQHRSWLTSDVTYIATALNTGAPLYPIETTDLNWFEDKIYISIKQTLAMLLESESESIYSHCFQSFGNTLRKLTESHNVSDAERLLNNINLTVDGFLNQYSSHTLDSSNSKLPMHLAQLASMHCFIYAEQPIALSKSVSALSLEEVSNLADILLKNPKKTKPITSCLPRIVLDEFYRLASSLSFEKETSKIIHTQKWYISQILSLAIARYIDVAFTTVYQVLKKFYLKENLPNPNTLLSEYECYRMVGGIEALEKLSYHIDLSRSVYEALNECRYASDIPFPTIDFDNYSSKIQNLRREIINSFVALSEQKGFKARDASTPDFFGHSYFLCIEECRFALRGDEERFKQMFPTTFALAMTAYSTVDNELNEQTEQIRIIYKTEFLEDIMALSGLAYIYSELNQMTFSKIIEEVWDNHLKTSADASTFINFLLMTIDYRKNIFGIKPRDVLRSGWDIEVSNEFRKNGLLRDGFSYSYPDSQPNHPSKLIQVLGQSYLAIHDTIEVFVCLYLLKHIDSSKVHLSPSIKSFKDSLERVVNEE